MQRRNTEKQLQRMSEVLRPEPEDTQPIRANGEVVFWIIATRLKVATSLSHNGIVRTKGLNEIATKDRQ